MKELEFLLSLTFLLTIGTVPYTIESHTHTVPSDSSIVNATPLIQNPIPIRAGVQKLEFANQFKRSNFDCIESLSDSTSPRIKIFEPDTSLTATMPVLKPKPVDQKVFIPGFECHE